MHHLSVGQLWVSALQQLHLPHSLSDAKAGQLLANWPSWIQRFVGISVGLFLFWVSVSALPHTWGSSIKACAIQISHPRNIAGTRRSAKGSPGVDLFSWDIRPGPWLLMAAKKSHKVVYKRGRMSPGIQIKRVKSRSPSEMHIRILIVTHLQVMLGEAAAKLLLWPRLLSHGIAQNRLTGQQLPCRQTCSPEKRWIDIKSQESQSICSR